MLMNFVVSIVTQCLLILQMTQAPLDLPTKPRHKLFISMINGIRDILLAYAITANPEIHSCWVEEFWDGNRSKGKDSKPLIKRKVAKKYIVIAEEDLRRV